MSNNKRQELYDRIRASSKDEVILEEMKRLGFWPADQEKADFSETLIQRKGELQRELNQLVKKQQLYADPEEALKAMRKQRMADSKQRRLDNKRKKIEQRHEKAVRWHERRKEEILYLGEGVSVGLEGTDPDKEKLDRYQLPHIATAKELSDAMGISLAELRFLSFNRDISRINHYQHFTLPKKTGGERLISAPMPRLKRAQYWVLANILEKIPLHDAAHGFRPGRSIVTNAQSHCRADVVINHDFKDFFPTLKYPRIRGLYRSLGYGEQVATILALLTTEADVQQVELDGDRYYVKQGERYLPQGAPSSPVLTNILCRRLDIRLEGAAKSLGFQYTRYADDLTFSGTRDSAKNLRKLHWRLETIVADEGFHLHPDKSRVMRRNSQQEVTGIVVNEKPSLDRKNLRRFRALLHQLEKNGPEGLHWGNSDNVLYSARGYANFVAMVDEKKGKAFLKRINGVIAKLSHQAEQKSRTYLSPALFKTAAAKGEAPREDWWVAAEPPVPQLPKLGEQKKQVAVTTVEESSPEQTIQSTQETPEEPAQDAYRSTAGRMRRFIGGLSSFLMWTVVISIGLVLMRTSPILGILFFVSVYFFRRGLNS